MSKLKGVSRSEYKGNDMLVIDKEARFPFQFGGGKAVMLLLACAVNGIGPMLTELLDVAGDKLNKSKDNPKGLTAAQVESLKADIAKLGKPKRSRTSSDSKDSKSSDEGKQQAA